MGKVKFQDNQPIQELHGTYANLTFKVVNGRTIAHVKARCRRPLEDNEWDKTTLIRQLESRHPRDNYLTTTGH